MMTHSKRKKAGSNDENILSSFKPPSGLDQAARKKIILELFRAGNDEAIAALAEIAAGDSSPEIRYYARKALNTLCRERPSLISKVAHQESPFSKIREAVSLALKEENSGKNRPLVEIYKRQLASLLPDLITALKKETDSGMRSFLLRLMGLAGKKEHIPFLAEFLKAPDGRERASAIEAIGAIDPDVAVHYLIPCLRDSEPRVRANAAIVLRKCRRERILSVLSSMVSSRNINYQDSAAFALSLIATHDTIPLLVSCLKSPSGSVRSKAFAALSKLAERGDKKAKSIIEKIDPSEMREITDRDIEKALLLEKRKQESIIRLLKSRDRLSKIRALQDIQTMPEFSWAVPLGELIRIEKDSAVLATAATTMGILNDRVYLPLIKTLLKHEDGRVRANAVEAFGKLASDKEVEQLRGMLGDSSNRVLANVIVILSTRLNLDLEPEIEAMVTSPDLFMRRSSMWIIRQLTPPYSARLLSLLIDDPFPELAAEARDLLEFLALEGDPEAKAFLDSPEKRVPPLKKLPEKSICPAIKNSQAPASTRHTASEKNHEEQTEQFISRTKALRNLLITIAPGFESERVQISGFRTIASLMERIFSIFRIKRYEEQLEINLGLFKHGRPLLSKAPPDFQPIRGREAEYQQVNPLTLTFRNRKASTTDSIAVEVAGALSNSSLTLILERVEVIEAFLKKLFEKKGPASGNLFETLHSDELETRLEELGFHFDDRKPAHTDISGRLSSCLDELAARGYAEKETPPPGFNACYITKGNWMDYTRIILFKPFLRADDLNLALHSRIFKKMTAPPLIFVGNRAASALKRLTLLPSLRTLSIYLTAEPGYISNDDCPAFLEKALQESAPETLGTCLKIPEPSEREVEFPDSLAPEDILVDILDYLM